MLAVLCAYPALKHYGFSNKFSLTALSEPGTCWLRVGADWSIPAEGAVGLKTGSVYLGSEIISNVSFFVLLCEALSAHTDLYKRLFVCRLAFHQYAHRFLGQWKLFRLWRFSENATACMRVTSFANVYKHLFVQLVQTNKEWYIFSRTCYQINVHLLSPYTDNKKRQEKKKCQGHCFCYLYIPRLLKKKKKNSLNFVVTLQKWLPLAALVCICDYSI